MIKVAILANPTAILDSRCQNGSFPIPILAHSNILAAFNQESQVRTLLSSSDGARHDEIHRTRCLAQDRTRPRYCAKLRSELMVLVHSARSDAFFSSSQCAMLGMPSACMFHFRDALSAVEGVWPHDSRVLCHSRRPPPRRLLGHWLLTRHGPVSRVTCDGVAAPGGSPPSCFGGPVHAQRCSDGDA